MIFASSRQINEQKVWENN